MTGRPPTPARPLDVWALNIYLARGKARDALIEQGMAEHIVQVRGIVAVRTQKAAMNAFGVTRIYLVGWGGITANRVEQEIARADPGVVYVTSDSTPSGRAGYVRWGTGEAAPTTP